MADSHLSNIPKLVVKNVGLMLSGDIERPVLDVDTIICSGDRITAVGALADCDAEGASVVVDAKGVTVAPGLIDSHVHLVLPNWTAGGDSPSRAAVRVVGHVLAARRIRPVRLAGCDGMYVVPKRGPGTVQ